MAGPNEAESRLPAGYLIYNWNSAYVFVFIPSLTGISKSLRGQHGETISNVKVGTLSGCHCAWLAALLRLTFSCCLLGLPCLPPPPPGYNTVVRIPAGATNIDIKQVSYSGKPEDDNYLGESMCELPPSDPTWKLLRAEKYLLQPREFSSRRSMPLSLNMTINHPDWEGQGRESVTLSRGERVLVESGGRGGPSRGKNVSTRGRGSRRGGPSLHLAAAEREAQGLFSSFFWRWRGVHFFCAKANRVSTPEKINETAIGAN